MESHLVLPYHQEGSSTMSPQIQQHENILSRGHWAMTNMGPRPSWATGRASVGAAVFNNSNLGGDESSSSWEVRAFAEDAASCSGQWPPRSYTCSFCQREFRTAQALGGHMNVHRRERAEANELALQHQHQQTVAPAPPPPLPLPLPLPPAAVQWCLYSPSPIPIPIPMAATSAASDDDEDGDGGPYLHGAGGPPPSILHFSNCKSTVMNKLYMGGAFQPYQSRQEAASVPSEDDHLDLELRLGPSMICGQ
ncbi:hypothetical protein Mapa_010940 [Marchantia paleacea]|nr:hypothetical protein Mapa_010940 [Marchantia paleacea]